MSKSRILRTYRAGWIVPVALAIAVVPTVATAAPSGDASDGDASSLSLGAGPLVRIPNGDVQGRVSLDYLYHFGGGGEGPALGLEVPINFTLDRIGVNVGPMFAWDVGVGQPGNASVYLGPIVTTGYGFASDLDGSDPLHFWYGTVGAQLRVKWQGPVGVFLRPASFGIWAGDGWVRGNYAATAGLSVAF